MACFIRPKPDSGQLFRKDNIRIAFTVRDVIFKIGVTNYPGFLTGTNKYFQNELHIFLPPALDNYACMSIFCVVVQTRMSISAFEIKKATKEHPILGCTDLRGLVYLDCVYHRYRKRGITLMGDF